MTSRRKWLLGICASAAILGLTLLAWQWMKPPAATVQFYGLVVDENGEPVEGAEVRAHASPIESANLPWEVQKKAIKRLATKTDAAGRFTLPVKENSLRIRDVRKLGYVLLMDWAWVPTHSPNANDVYLFGVPGGRNYQPDPNRPAIFPLIGHRARSLTPTSRGGSDVYPDGRVVVNEPILPLIPNAGPDAPKTSVQIGQRLKAILATRPSLMHTSQPLRLSKP